VTAQVRKAVFPVGGLGTRFLPATKSVPKEMLPVVDTPLIQYAVEEALASGIEDIIFVTGRGKSAIEDHFDHGFELEHALAERGKTAELGLVTGPIQVPGRIAYTRQQTALGLGHAVWCARELVGDEPFAVLLADDLVKAETPCLAQLLEVHRRTGGNVVAVMDVPRAHTERYGILEVAADDGTLAEVKGLVEKPAPKDAPSTLSIIGRYVLLPEIFAELDRQERGAGNEIQLTDAMARRIGHAPFHGLRFEGRRFDCGDKAGFLEANLAFALAREDLAGQVREFLGDYV
jgi:UTP--glucose-1-phosphate uridylyltransferase